MLTFFHKYRALITFGILQIFFSAPGQTFLIALFVGPIFKELHISQSFFAGLYSAATLSAAILLNPAGRLIDRYHIRTIVKFATILMAMGCLLLGLATNVVMVFCAFFLLRLIGQGVYGLCASTLMVKSFHKNRGKAMGLITLGFPLSEAIYPTMAVLLLQSIGWRQSYFVFGFVNIFLMLPIQLYLLNRSHVVHGEFQLGETDINPQHLRGNPEQRKIRRHKDIPLNGVVRDFKFYLLIISSCLPPMVVTGLFFHQNTLFDANNWNIGMAAGGLLLYAICKAAGSLWIGGIVDRIGPLLPFSALIFLLGVGTLMAGTGGSSIQIFTYFALIGAALGFSSPVTNVVFPYFYGTKHMGSIKGLVATYRNGLTALGPLPVAIALDAGISINTILCGTAIVVMSLSTLPW
ncbi:MAG: MFS transporter, partial [Anaerolineae bacterium]|nr:MFS transporter [Anaerolineae bacterium]